MSKIESSSAKRATVDPHDEAPNQPPSKRHRAPLNFSIESIMRPIIKHNHNNNNSPDPDPVNVSRSPSPSSDAGSIRSSGAESSASTLDSHQQQNGKQQLGAAAAVANHQHNNQPQQTANHHQAGTSSGQPKSSLSSSSSKSHRSSHHHSANSRIKPVCTDSRLAPFECHLDNLDLWHRFHPLDTEMIITKQGRRMFPPVRVTFSFNDQLLHQQQQQQAASCNQQQQLQFNSRDRYQVLMDILPYDNKRYRYAYHKSSWQQAGKADPPSPTKLFLHPDGPFTLDQLKRQVISFEKIKLTNNDGNKHGYIVLNSMHKYQPRIHLILWRGKESQNLANAPVNLLDQEAHKTFIFSETIFTAVTAYQNHSITKLKIDSNPFAKGFRDSTRLTDLELESMQDLIADGQCPFSPPRAPPPGFPHFLFAAANQQFNGSMHPQHQQTFAGGHPAPPPPPYQFSAQMPPSSKQPVEDATAALLRERTIMALDSFLQQQQQQQQSSSESPNQFGATKPVGLNVASISPSSRSEQLQSSCSPASNNNNGNQASNNNNNNNNSSTQNTMSPSCNHPFNPFASGLLTAQPGGPIPQHASAQTGTQQQQPLPPPLSMGGPLPAVPTSQAGQFEQFIMQQQQQFAAAMAAAAASGVHQHPAYLQSLFAQAAVAQQQQQCQAPPPVGSTTPTPTSQTINTKLDSSSASPPVAQQMTQQPTIITSGHQHQQHQQHQQQQQQQQQQHLEQTSPIGLAKSANRLQLDLNQFLGGAGGHPIAIPITSSAGGSATGPQHHQIHPKQLHAIMQHHQMQQIAALAHQQQQQHHHPNHHLNLNLSHYNQQHHLQPAQQACLQMEPMIELQDHSGVVAASRRAATKNK